MARSPCIRPADILLRRLRRLRAHPMVISAQATRGSELGGPNICVAILAQESKTRKASRLTSSALQKESGSEWGEIY